MAEYVCIIQEGQEAERQKDALSAALKKLGQEAFGDDPAQTEIDWRVIKPDFAWTAGEPSHSSVVIRSVPVGLPNERREPFLRAVGELFVEHTGCHINDVVITAWDGPLPV
ncbi:MAG: hypothetical protein QNK05_23515 [Myxococcota bacterium]|nr:hypothetical protein [Myxococcota bacterium]